MPGGDDRARPSTAPLRGLVWTTRGDVGGTSRFHRRPAGRVGLGEPVVGAAAGSGQQGPGQDQGRLPMPNVWVLRHRVEQHRVRLTWPRKHWPHTDLAPALARRTPEYIRPNLVSITDHCGPSVFGDQEIAAIEQRPTVPTLLHQHARTSGAASVGDHLINGDKGCKLLDEWRIRKANEGSTRIGVERCQPPLIIGAVKRSCAAPAHQRSKDRCPTSATHGSPGLMTPSSPSGSSPKRSGTSSSPTRVSASSNSRSVSMTGIMEYRTPVADQPSRHRRDRATSSAYRRTESSRRPASHPSRAPIRAATRGAAARPWSRSR
jgi:hypothetical protein